MKLFHVYVIGPIEGFPVKIGMATNPVARLCDLQVSNWEKLYIHDLFVADDKGAAHRFEKLAHKRLSNSRMNGEWFNIFAADASGILEELAKEVGKLKRSENKYGRYGKDNIDFIEKLDNMGCI
jgi:hypothetical protein